jgi:hypothetical protein
MIKSIQKSNKKNKRYQVILSNGEKIDFGLNTGKTYIDHNDNTKRLNYFKRHFANPKEYQLISNLIPSPALMSMFILWGPYKTINENINFLNKLLSKKYN